MTDVNELKHHLIETWSATSGATSIKRLISGEIVLTRASKSKAVKVLDAHQYFRYLI